MTDKKMRNLKRTYGILYGELSGQQEDYLIDRDDLFTYAFLRLTEIVAGSVTPVDEAQLKITANKFEYLKNIEGVYAEYFSLEYQWYKHEIGPFMGFYGEDKTPVLFRYKKMGCYMLSLEDNTEQKVTAEIASHVHDRGLMIMPKMEKSLKNSRQLLWEAVKSQKKEYGLFFLLMILASTITVVVPSGTQSITGYMLDAEDVPGIMVVALSLIIGIVSGLLINIVVNRSKVRLQTKIGYFLSSTVIGRIMDLNVRDEKRLSSRLIALLMPFINGADTLLSASLTVILYLVQSIMILTVTFSPQNGISDEVRFLIYGEIVLMMIWQFGIARRTRKLREADSRLTTIRREILNNVEAIKNNAIEDRIFYRFAVNYDEKMTQQRAIDDANQRIQILSTAVSSIVMLVTFMLVATGLTPASGTMAALISSLSLLMSYVGNLSMSASEVVSALPYMSYADMILKLPVEGSNSGIAEQKITGRIELRNVSYAYREDSAPVIKNLNLTIEPGEYVGIVGGSGCGKSTLMQLMLGFLKPTDGKIYYDNVELEQYNLRSLRRQFGVVLQSAPLINGSIKTNIGLSQEPDMEAVKEAARLAAVLDEIEAMPMKFNTPLSSEIETVSGGQRQRIAMARALMSKPTVLFLDEATSAVDNVSQKVITDNLKAMGVTRIAIAHRLSTIEHCDRILVMEKGEIVEQGSFEELMAKDGRFAQMARRNIV
ncbi:MAG: ATP-binding cassette domain-containing protein [Lachnospiraceae bacterium]|nr:ATP-binding cassette domain-containing protein [Lachnospiraceae bacterium]